jgi:hypothetical protein
VVENASLPYSRPLVQTPLLKKERKKREREKERKEERKEGRETLSFSRH